MAPRIAGGALPDGLATPGPRRLAGIPGIVAGVPAAFAGLPHPIALPITAPADLAARVPLELGLRAQHIAGRGAAGRSRRSRREFQLATADEVWDPREPRATDSTAAAGGGRMIAKRRDVCNGLRDCPADSTAGADAVANVPAPANKSVDRKVTGSREMFGGVDNYVCEKDTVPRLYHSTRAFGDAASEAL